MTQDGRNEGDLYKIRTMLNQNYVNLAVDKHRETQLLTTARVPGVVSSASGQIAPVWQECKLHPAMQQSCRGPLQQRKSGHSPRNLQEKSQNLWISLTRDIEKRGPALEKWRGEGDSRPAWDGVKTRAVPVCQRWKDRITMLPSDLQKIIINNWNKG